MTLYAEQSIRTPDFEAIPEQLKKHPKWMVWKAVPTEKDPNKMGKVPFLLNGKKYAEYNNPNHWVTFEEAKRAFQTGKFDGVGVVINRSDQLVCIDLDDFDDINDIPVEKHNLTLHSYTEYSPSETGLHIWVMGKKPEWAGTKKNGVEFFGNIADKFVTVTGYAFNPKPIVENQKLIDHIANKYFKEDEVGGDQSEPFLTKTDLTDEQVLNIALQNLMTRKLYRGDFSDYKSDSKSDQSKADFALCYDLAKITNDPEQIERLFKKSGLYRKPPLKHKSYPQRTAKKALEKVWKETSKTNKTSSQGVVIDHPNKYYTYNHQGQLKFNTHLVKDEILSEIPIYRSDIGILQYENGVYKRVLKDDIKHIIQSRIKEEATTSRKQEITELILHENKAIPLSEFNSKYKILNVKNGIYHIPTGTFREHSQECLWTIQLPVKYDPEASCPAILDFLHDILDEESVRFLIEWIAYMTLTYSDPDKVLFLHGTGGNGKGVLINILQHFLGYENVSNMSLNDLEDDKFSRAHLYGKLANICGDIDNRVISNTGIIKSLTGGDTVYAQFKGIDGFNFRSFAKLMFSANELPMSKDKTHGWFRRLFILPFEKQIPEEKKIARSILDKKLTSPEELSGLLNLVIKAIHKLEQNGYEFTVPKSAQNALEEYKFAHDKVEQFIQEEGERDPTKRETVKHFYDAYCYWCRENGNIPEQKRKIKDKLIEKGFIIEKGSGNKDFIFGFSFSQTSDYR